MRKIILLVVVCLVANLTAGATTYTINTSGFSFAPDEIHINLGDTVLFEIGSMHNAVEVSKATWDADGNTSNGGFSVPFGGGMVIILTTGMHYYVCTPHASLGMKGKIEVTDAAGIKEAGRGYKFSIYPNPVNNILHINYNAYGINRLSIEIYNVAGSLVYRTVDQPKEGNNSWDINVSLLQAGTYYLSLRNGKDAKTEEFIVQ